MNKFEVNWTNKLTAETALDAAKIAAQDISNGMSTEFLVVNLDTEELFVIDINKNTEKTIENYIENKENNEQNTTSNT